MPAIETTPELVRSVYARLARNLESLRARLGRPLSYAEKVFLGHLADPERAEIAPGRSYMETRPDRVAMQDATAQMALLQFMLTERDETAVPTTVHCDHLIQAYSGAASDMRVAQDTNREVYDFLRTASARHGIGFWGPGRGDHPSGRAREVRLPRRHDDRHRLAHPQRRRPRRCSPAAWAAPTRST